MRMPLLIIQDLLGREPWVLLGKPHRICEVINFRCPSKGESWSLLRGGNHLASSLFMAWEFWICGYMTEDKLARPLAHVRSEITTSVSWNWSHRMNRGGRTLTSTSGWGEDESVVMSSCHHKLSLSSLEHTSSTERQVLTIMWHHIIPPEHRNEGCPSITPKAGTKLVIFTLKSPSIPSPHIQLLRVSVHRGFQCKENLL